LLTAFANGCAGANAVLMAMTFAMAESKLLTSIMLGARA
jgi:hypothetical protein